MNLQYWIEYSQCVCSSLHPIGGCLHCDFVEYEKQRTETIVALKRAQAILDSEYPDSDSRHPSQWGLNELITKLET